VADQLTRNGERYLALSHTLRAAPPSAAVTVTVVLKYE